jgi:hypothetical protein
METKVPSEDVWLKKAAERKLANDSVVFLFLKFLIKNLKFRQKVHLLDVRMLIGFHVFIHNLIQSVVSK